MKIKMRILNLPSFLNFSFFLLTLLYHTYGIFSVKDFSANTWVRVLKFGTKLDSDELYCVAKTATYCLSVDLFVHFSFSPMKIYVTDFSAPIGASVFKFCVHLQVSLSHTEHGWAHGSNMLYSVIHGLTGTAIPLLTSNCAWGWVGTIRLKCSTSMYEQSTDILDQTAS